MAMEPHCPVCDGYHYGICPKAPAAASASLRERILPPAPKFLTFVADQEPWTQYTLENGAVIRVRLVLVKAIDEGELLPDGTPRYQCQFQQVMDITWPEDIQREIAKRQVGGDGE
jgi:hypothetical protein